MDCTGTTDNHVYMLTEIALHGAENVFSEQFIHINERSLCQDRLGTIGKKLREKAFWSTGYVESVYGMCQTRCRHGGRCMFAQNPACECVQKWGWRGPDCNTDVNECSLEEVGRWKNGFLRVESVLFEREKSAFAKTGLGQTCG